MDVRGVSRRNCAAQRSFIGSDFPSARLTSGSQPRGRQVKMHAWNVPVSRGGQFPFRSPTSKTLKTFAAAFSTGFHTSSPFRGASSPFRTIPASSSKNFNSGAFWCSLVLSGGLPAQLDHDTPPRVAFGFAGTSRRCPGRLGGREAWATSRTWLVAKTCASQIFLERRHFFGFGIDPFGKADKNGRSPTT